MQLYLQKLVMIWLMNTLEMPLANICGYGDGQVPTRDVVIKCCKKAGLKVEKFEIRKGMRMENESVDTVVSMNGFHAFPDKQKAFHEIWRVLKPGGNFIACFYIRGKSKRTDWLVKNILAKKGWFSPPFQTEKELRDILQKLYKETDLHVDGSMVYFSCVK